MKITEVDQVFIEFPMPEPTTLQPLDLKLDILFEDSDLIVINKPSGLVVHPSAGHAQDTLVNALLNYTQDLSMKFGDVRPGIVHRIDRDTSGILVIAKNDFTHEGLAKQFKEKTAHRIYYAACVGVPPKLNGTIYSYLARHPYDRKKYSSVSDVTGKIIRDPTLPPEAGKWAVTHYEVLQSLPSNVSLLKLKLETGRTHQIRVHLAESGFPIISDPIYFEVKKLKNIRSSSTRDTVKDFPHLALHAAELGFVHPRTLENKRFQVGWPEEMKSHLTAIGFK